MALYLESSPRAFLYFFVTRPKSPITWLSLISRRGLNKLEAFTQSFKHFKDGFFKVVVKLAGQSHFYTADGNTKFPFFWTDNPWRYKVISREDLSVGEKEVVDTLMQFSDKMPTKGLIRVYNSVHPIIDIEGIFICNFEHCNWLEYFDDLCVVYFRAYSATWQEELDTFSSPS